MSEALDDVNAATLHFGHDFRVDETGVFGDDVVQGEEPNVQVLSNDEVYFLLELQRQKMLEPGNSVDDLNETFKSLHSHLEKVVTTRNFEDLQSIASTLSPLLEATDLLQQIDDKERGAAPEKVVKLHPYERSSLINLLKSSDTTPEEARCWVPSLARFDDANLEKVIALIADAKEKVTQGL